MGDKIGISEKVIVDLDAVTFATFNPDRTVSYALAGDPNKFTATGVSARILWDALQERSDPLYLYDKYQEKR